MIKPTTNEVNPVDEDIRKRAFDQLAGVMLDAGNATKTWTNGFDPDISEMLATDRGGFFDSLRYPVE